MEAGIVGLPNIGKSTLFNALTVAGAACENYPFCTLEPNVGVVPVADARLATIAKFVETVRVTPAVVRLVDIAGLVKGASTGEGLGNKFLAHIRSVDALIHLVRCFAGAAVAHVEGAVDPGRDLETVDVELLLADLETVTGALAKAARLAKSGDKEARQRVEILEQCHRCLDRGDPIRRLHLDRPEAAALLSSYGLLTAKQVLYVANVAEDDLSGRGPLALQVRQYADADGGVMVPVCAQLESELAELDDAERQEWLADLGLAEPALEVLTRAAYRLLGLQTFFTTRSRELRAWTIPVGAGAAEAAGVIHSDFQRGFIRAEVYTVAELEQYQSEAALRAAGKLRTEGKDYRIHDGDVCHFLFQV